MMGADSQRGSARRGAYLAVRGPERRVEDGVGRVHAPVQRRDARGEVAVVEGRVLAALQRRVHHLERQDVARLGEHRVLAGRQQRGSEARQVGRHLVVAEQLARHGVGGRRLFRLLARVFACQAQLDHLANEEGYMSFYNMWNMSFIILIYLVYCKRIFIILIYLVHCDRIFIILIYLVKFINKEYQQYQ